MRYNQESKFTGGLLGLIGINILTGLITLITLGIATPWAICIREQWIAEHTIIDKKQVVFDGEGGELFGHYILWLLLTIVTLGIYSFWFDINLKKWIVQHTHLEPYVSASNDFYVTTPYRSRRNSKKVINIRCPQCGYQNKVHGDVAVITCPNCKASVPTNQ